MNQSKRPFEHVGAGFIQVPNEVVDIIMRHIDPAPLCVLVTVIRLTEGFHQPTIEISLQDIAERTGLSKQGVIDSIAKLGKMLIVKKQVLTDGNRARNVYSLNRKWPIPAEWLEKKGGVVNSVYQGWSTQCTTLKDTFLNTVGPKEPRGKNESAKHKTTCICNQCLSGNPPMQ